MILNAEPPTDFTYLPTIGITIQQLTDISLKKLELWDSIGLPEFKGNAMRGLYRHAAVFICVIDLSNIASLHIIPGLIANINDNSYNLK